ncbi:MAG: putative DNA-binding domain-containing protein [Planctomycetaceae bacterium]|nr:putative DNA-binding domain-containing protein [Planctomycetaceae bacterium]
MPEDLPLDRVQRWFQAVITHPLGVAAGSQSEGARAHLKDPLESVVSRSQRLSAADRLNVYANAYYARLLECLQSDYPALRRALGDEIFNQFVLEYLQSYPSQSYTLSELGARFPQFLAETQPSEEPGSPPSWPEFLIDLARLERAYAEVFDGPGSEGQPPLRLDDLAALPPDQWGEVVLDVGSGLRLESFRFPVHRYCSAARKETFAEFPDPMPTHLAIYRQDFVVRRLEVTPLQFRLLDALRRNMPLGQAVATAVQSVDSSDDSELARLQEWFAEWALLGFFRGVRTNESGDRSDS